MTTVISRLYADETTANNVVETLEQTGFPRSAISLITEPNPDLIAETRVSSSDAVIYASNMQAGNILVVVRASVNPFGAARSAMSIMDSVNSLQVGVVHPNRYIREKANPQLFLSVLTKHPRFFSMDVGPDTARDRGLFSQAMGWKLLSEHRTRRSGSSGWFTSTKILPFSLLSKKRSGRSAISGGRRWLYNPKKLA